MSDRLDDGRITIDYVDGRGARLKLEPGSDHPEGRYTVTEYYLTKGGEWRPTGTDDVRGINIERPGDAPLRRHLRAALEACGDADARFHLRQALQVAESCEVLR